LEIRFTRRNYENITEKANVLVAMLNNPKIAPQLAFSHCGMFIDPEMAWNMSKAYMEEQAKKAAEIAAQTTPKEGDNDDPGNNPVAKGDTGDQ